jgi:hypothetical protein
MASEKKIKVWNRTKGIHYIVFSDGLRKFPIAAGGFNLIPIEEVYFINSTSRSFSKGLLEIDPLEKELLIELGYDKRSPNTYTPKEMEKLLNNSFNKNTKEIIKNITERHAKEILIGAARKLDLSQSKVDFIEEVTGMEVYNELLKEDKKDSNVK